MEDEIPEIDFEIETEEVESKFKTADYVPLLDQVDNVKTVDSMPLSMAIDKHTSTSSSVRL